MAAGLHPDPPGRLQCSPNPLAGCNGWVMGKEVDREEGIKRGGGRKGNGREGRRGKKEGRSGKSRRDIWRGSLQCQGPRGGKRRDETT